MQSIAEIAGDIYRVKAQETSGCVAEQLRYDADPIAFTKREAAQWRQQARIDTYGGLAYFDGGLRLDLMQAEAGEKYIAMSFADAFMQLVNQPSRFARLLRRA